MREGISPIQRLYCLGRFIPADLVGAAAFEADSPIDLSVASLAERVAQPFKALVQTVTTRGASGLDVLQDLLVGAKSK